MRRRHSLNLALAGLVVALGAVLWLNRPEQEPPPQPITPLAMQEIKRVTIAFPDAETIRLERTEHGWRLRAPINARVRAAAMDQVLKLAERKSKRHMKLSEVDPGAIGLATPFARVTFNNKTVALGATEPLNDRTYALVGNTVHLITSPNTEVLNADYSDLVSWRLLPKDVTIQRLVLPKATLTPTGDGGWTAAAKNHDYSAEAVGRTVDLWKRTRAMFVEPASDNKAHGKVTIKTVHQGTLVFEIVSRNPQLLLRRPDIGILFHVAGNRMAPLLKMQHPELQKLKSKSDIPLAANGG